MEEFSAVKMFLLEGNDKCLLIDTGVGLTDLPAMIKQITDKPVVVVNSHFHIDHIGENGQSKTNWIPLTKILPGLSLKLAVWRMTRTGCNHFKYP